MNLKINHLSDLKSSGLDEKIIQIAGIYSTNFTKDLLGFEVGPSLVFPYGDGYYRVKPDKPFVDKDGNIAKYLTPKDKPNKLYICSNLLSGALTDPSIPLCITEGEKKTLKLIQEGFPSIGTVGVWGWKIKDKEKLIPDFDDITLKERLIYIVFDSDRKDNPLIRQAEYRLAKLLKEKGASVKIVILPHSIGGEKQGVDDFLVAEGKEKFKKLLEKVLEPKDSTMKEIEGKFYKFAEDGYKKVVFEKNKETKEIQIAKEENITNFTIHFDRLLKIDEEDIVIYEGYLKAKSTNRIFPFRWEIWKEDNLTKYIQKEIQKTVGLVYSPYKLELIKNLASYFNYGTREINAVNSLGYHKGKYITPSFIIENGEIKENKELPINLTRARYTQKYDFLPCEKQELPKIAEFILADVVNFHYKSYILPLLGIVGLAPIQHLLKLPNFIVFVEGITEAGKTIVLKLFMNFFADQSEEDGLPSISSTITDLEIDGYFAKDSIYPIDDFKLENIRDKNVINIIQNAHDRHGRGRRYKDLKKHLDYYIRGIPIFTGEEIFQNVASSISRMIVLRVPYKSFSVDEIKRVFSKRNLLRKITPHYIAWTQRNPQTELLSTPSLQLGGRTEQFARQILTGLRSFFTFLNQECKVERDKLIHLIAETLYSLTGSVAYTGERIQAEKKEVIFIEGMKSLLSAGLVTLGESNSKTPSIGFYDSDSNIYYINPEIAVKKVSELTGAVFSTKSLGKNLKEAEMLAEVRSDGKPSILKKYKGINHSYWAIRGDLIGVYQTEETKT